MRKNSFFKSDDGGGYCLVINACKVAAMEVIKKMSEKVKVFSLRFLIFIFIVLIAMFFYIISNIYISIRTDRIVTSIFVQGDLLPPNKIATLPKGVYVWKIIPKNEFIKSINSSDVQLIDVSNMRSGRFYLSKPTSIGFADNENNKQLYDKIIVIKPTF